MGRWGAGKEEGSPRPGSIDTRRWAVATRVNPLSLLGGRSANSAGRGCRRRFRACLRAHLSMCPYCLPCSLIVFFLVTEGELIQIYRIWSLFVISVHLVVDRYAPPARSCPG